MKHNNQNCYRLSDILTTDNKLNIYSLFISYEKGYVEQVLLVLKKQKLDYFHRSQILSHYQKLLKYKVWFYQFWKRTNDRNKKYFLAASKRFRGWKLNEIIEKWLLTKTNIVDGLHKCI